MIARRFRLVRRLVAVLALGLTAQGVLPSVVTAAQADTGQDPVVEVQSEVYPPSIKAALDNRERAALKRVYTKDSIPNSVTLPPVTEVPPPTASDRAKGRLQVGFSRDVPAGASLGSAALIWDAVEGGSVTAVSVASPGGVAVRLAVAFGSLPAGSEVRFFAPGADSQVFGPVTPEQIRALTLPAEAGDPGVYWSPVVSGDTAGMEIFVPTGLERDLSFTIPRVSHQYRSVESAEKAAGSCNIDIACASASWGTTARAVAKIQYISGGGSFECTGTLLNDTDSSTFIPYFMTAEHCVSTQSEASTINSFWNYQRTTCGGLLGSYTTLFGGATLLSHGAGSDHSFLRLNDPAPSSATFEGWTSATVSSGTSMVGIHHPDGDVKKISLGVIDGIANYSGPVTGAGGYLRVHWTAGVTEGGSSGSALITGSYPNDKFVGTLKGGSSSCSVPTGGDWYGRFDLVYPLISAYLSPAVATPKLTSLTANVTFPAAYSVPITFTAAATGGPAPLQYKFLLFSASTGWVVGRDYSSTNTFTWSPPEGTNAVQVWVRAAGSTATYQDWMGSNTFTVVSSAKVTSLSANVTFPAVYSVPITFTATATGGPAPLQYKFLLFSTATGWVVGRDYSSTNTFTWSPPEGINAVQVWVRAAGSTAFYQDWMGTSTFTVVSIAPTLTSLSPNVAFPAAYGVPITFTAAATGGPAPLQYKFLLFSAATGWVVGRDYSSSNTFTWSPPEGMNAVQVWLRAAGSAATYQDWMGTSTFTVVSIAPKLTSLSANVTFPAAYNVPITFTAAATGGPAPLQYKFLLFSAATGWVVGRDYSSSNTFTWFPPQGLNAVQVWVRAAGSTASYEDWMTTGTFSLGMTMAQSTTLPALSSTTRISLMAFGSGSVLEDMFVLRPQSDARRSRGNGGRWTSATPRPSAKGVVGRSLQPWPVS